MEIEHPRYKLMKIEKTNSQSLKPGYHVLHLQPMIPWSSDIGLTCACVPILVQYAVQP